MSIVLSVITEFNGKGLQKAIKEFQELKTNGERAQLAISKAALPAAAALAAVGAAAVMATKAAMEESAAQTQLAIQIKRSTGATTQQIVANESFIESLQYASAVSDSELRPALSSLVVATHDLGSAQNLLKTSLDVSAATGKDLQTVSSALAKAYAGNMKGLQALSPEMKKAIKDGATFSEALAILTTNFGGSSAAAANTAEGGFRQFQIALDDAKEKIGTGLLPIMKSLTPMLRDMAKFVGNNAVAITILVGTFATFAAALLAAKAAMVIYNAITAVTTAFNTGLAISFTAVQVATVVGIATAIAGAATLAVLATKIRGAVNAQNEYTAAADAATGANQRWYSSIQGISSIMAAFDAAVAKNEADKKSSAENAASAAKQLLKSTKDALEKAKQTLRDYASSLKDTVNGFLSLSEAVATANESESNYTDAVKERLDAYAQLNALQAKGLYTTQEMADATDRVAKAELNLSNAQAKRTNYSAEFQKQLTAAKTFAGQLTTLAPKLSKAAMAQLISLGPVAGSAVAADLIAGTGAMTTSSLNADLETLNTAGVGLGDAAIAGDMGLLNQAKVGQSGNNVYITVTSADPNAVVDALKRYMKTNGKVPIKVTN